MTTAVPRIVTTPPKRTHRPGAASIDIKPKSPAARRMSMSSTPQSFVQPTAFEVILRRPQLFLGALLAFVMVTGIMISLVFDTSLDTSTLALHPIRTAYFATKTNIFNRLFVKKCWGWTSLFFITHFASSPPSRNQASRLAAFLAASGFWLVFTTWFFGAGLGDRVIALSGGACAVPLPQEWDLDYDALQPLLPASFPSLLSPMGESGDSKKQLYLPLPPAFCSLRIPLNPKTHPELFSILSASSLSFPFSSETNTLHPTEEHPPLTLPIPRWSNGFDISGHAFLLTLASMLLVRELAPSWKAMYRGTFGNRPASRRQTIHTVSTYAGSALLALWIWMIFMTSIYFHNPSEKITGLEVRSAALSRRGLEARWQAERARVEYTFSGLRVPKKKKPSGREDDNNAYGGECGKELDEDTDAVVNDEYSAGPLDEEDDEGVPSDFIG
ncbi:ABC-2 type transport system permease protein, partial [Tremellales sp. Uapishka_1]